MINGKPVRAVTHMRIKKDSYQILIQWLNATGTPPHLVSKGGCDSENKVNVCFICDYEYKHIFEQLLEKASRLDGEDDIKFWERQLKNTRGGHHLNLQKDILC